MRGGARAGIPFGVQWFFDGDGGGGGGGSGEAGDTERRNLESLLAKKNGDGVALAAQLLAENNAEREKRRRLNDTLAELRDKVPGDGALVLGADDARAWSEYRELGPAGELKAAIAEREALRGDVARLQGENAAAKRDGLLREVAGEAGFRFSVLKDRDERTPGLEYLKKPVSVDGRAIDRWHVRYRDGDDAAPVQEMALDEFARTRWSDFLPALKVEAAAEPGTRVVTQGSGGASGAGSLFDRIRRDAAEQGKAVVQGPGLEERLNMRS